MKQRASTASWIAAVIVVLAVVGSGVYLARKATQAVPPAAVAPVASTAAPTQRSERAAAPVEHPIELAQSAPAAAASSPLPAPGESDAYVAAQLTAVAGSDISSLLVSQRIIERIVATVDALPRHEALGVLTLPAQVPKGAFVVDASDPPRIAGQNSQRYAPYMHIIQTADPQALVTWYVRAYPLFQHAYRQLGYPEGYFNDRLIVAIDDMLAAPEPVEAPALMRSKAFYIYADPMLESLSTGQKLLLRVGSANAGTIKAKLRAIRALLVGQGHPPVAAASAG